MNSTLKAAILSARKRMDRCLQEAQVRVADAEDALDEARSAVDNIEDALADLGNIFEECEDKPPDDQDAILAEVEALADNAENEL